MRKIFFSIIVILFLVSPLFAQRGGRVGQVLEVRLASPLPRESPWGRTLDRIAVEWDRITGGQVRLNVRHGGIEGNEATVQLALASDIIQAAVFTSFGLSVIEPSIMTMSAPFLIRNEEELRVVMREVQGDLEARFNNSQYLLLAWSESGFVNIFSREPVFTPDDLRRLRIASNPEAMEMNTAFKTMGFNLIEADWGDTGTMLNAGTVTAIYQNPAAVAAFQLHSILGHMLTTNIAPVVGGIVINQVTWRRIGELNPRFQAELMETTRRIGAEFDRSLERTVNDAVQTMTRAGLRVNRPSAAQERIWFEEMNRVVPSLLGTAFDRDLYNRINAILTRHRGQ
ncbi:MAG: TRAP transporter substrate-binding protein DctP [Treponema sp.]|nr:TRAP transporter substrate-binding protein DctP [Treponema sp.]